MSKIIEAVDCDDEVEFDKKLEDELYEKMGFKKPVDKENPTHYVNNKEFYEAMKEYIYACREVPEGQPFPRVPEYIGECFLKIAQRTFMRANFNSYTYKEDMIGDAVEDCLIYMRNFNPDLYKNPFGYFSTYVWNAFVRKIEDEEKNRYKRAKSIQFAGIDSEVFAVQEHDIDEEYQNSMLDFLRDNDNIIVEYEAKMARRKEKQAAAKRAREDAGEQPIKESKLKTKAKLKKSTKKDTI